MPAAFVCWVGLVVRDELGGLPEACDGQSGFPDDPFVRFRVLVLPVFRVLHVVVFLPGPVVGAVRPLFPAFSRVSRQA